MFHQDFSMNLISISYREFYSTLKSIKLLIFPVFVAILFNSLSLKISAQSDSTGFTLDGGVDLMSRYIWRGQEYGHAPSIQPALSASWKGFTLGTWGAYKFNGAGEQETDLYFSKEIGPLSLAVWDYFTFSDTSDFDYFNYSESGTSHIFEAQALISGGEKIPFNLLAGYFFYGADSSKSLYFELQYLPKFLQADLQFFAGVQAKGDFYASQAAFVNLGCSWTKSIPVSNHFSLPLSISFIINPDRKSTYLVAGINL